MADSTTTKPTPGSPVSASIPSPVSLRYRRDSIASASTSSVVDREQLASTLDKIHNTASQSDALTTFNDFAPPPRSSPSTENKGNAAGDIVSHGLSGLYSRFREAVGAGGSPVKAHDKDEGGPSTATRPPRASLNHLDTIMPTSPTSSQPTPISEKSSSSVFALTAADIRAQSASSKSLMGAPLSASSSRPSLAARTRSAATIDPAIVTVTAHRDQSRSTTRTDDSSGHDSGRKSLTAADLTLHMTSTEPGVTISQADGPSGRRSRRDDASSYDGSVDAGSVNQNHGLAPPSMPPKHRHARSESSGSAVTLDGPRRMPAVIDRINHPRNSTYAASRDSSMDRGVAEANPINTAAHDSIYHDSFGMEAVQQKMPSGDTRISGTTTMNEAASEHVNAQLERMRKQVMSKEFWMKDDTVKECFLCQTPFSAFRRKHHCRTCGCIFDSKCTVDVPGEKFGVPGSIRVCKRCVEAINRRFEGSGSDEDDSGDEHSFIPRIFGGQAKRAENTGLSTPRESEAGANSEGSEDARSLSAPMMAIPATRRVNRNSAVLEIDAPQLSRPGSSRSLKSLASGRPSSAMGHKRHHSKHGFLGRFKPSHEDHAPFRKGIDEEHSKRPKFPAFHDDNIIDPELADFMSDDSSGDEQMSIFATMSTSDLASTNLDNDKTNLSPFMNAGRKGRHRPGEKSLSGLSYLSRDEGTGPSSIISHRRSNRRRNLSNVSGSVHHLASPRPKSAIFKGHSASSEMLYALDQQIQGGTQLTRSDSLRKRRISKTELNKSSLRHVDRLIHQLLDDAGIPNPTAWQKALVPILLQCTDDVSPDVANGEDMDIRHYVKLKRIPGGKPGDTSYISGVVFTKNLALKSMHRRIPNPRIVLITFPIEYQRHEQHFMSLQPVIEQEREFLRVVVQRITNLRPHLVLAEKGVSGIALQYLSEANISVAYNVKHTVIEAVSRCAETEIISSLDRLALPVRVGRCAGFEVKTFVNNDHPGRKKSYIFLSGCRPDLGCTIALRGANNALLAKVKYIMEFMVYVVYNLKLESSLLRDESIEAPDDGESSMTNSYHTMNDSFRSLGSDGSADKVRQGPALFVQQPSNEGEMLQNPKDGSSSTPEETGQHLQPISLHEAHQRDHQDTQVPDDVPMPTFYSDMVAKYETKILSASPYVKFKQPYLLMKAREQERRLLYLKRLRDHDVVDQSSDDEKANPPAFQLIKPEMVEQIGQKASRNMMEILHAVHDAEYDKALFNYRTQTRQWETYIQGNLDLFDPFSHQNIVVLYSEICTDTKIPCTEPSIVAISFYDEQHVYTGMDPDCTLGQYIQDLAETRNRICESNGCEKKLSEHHKTYVHDESRVTIFVEDSPLPLNRRADMGDRITMWTYCKVCKKDSDETVMSDITYKYSFGKYLELLYWGRGLQMKGNIDCTHDHHRDHVRYFSLGDARIRIHWDPIDLLEIVVPRTRITWKVGNDLNLKNDIFIKTKERWLKFVTSVKSRLTGIRIDSVLPEKADLCKAEVDVLTKKVNDEQTAIISRLEDIYAQSKYYEVVPFNSLVRDMLEIASEWDEAFANFEADYLGEKDIRQLTMLQLKKMFTDHESKESVASSDAAPSVTDSDGRPSQTFSEVDDNKTTQPTEYTDSGMEGSSTYTPLDEKHTISEIPEEDKTLIPAEGTLERVEPLDLASSPTTVMSTPSTTTSNASPDDSRPGRPSVTPLSTGRSPTLTEKITQLRREQASQAKATGEASSPEDARQVAESGAARVSDTSVSPPLVRASSHPARALSRTRSSLGQASNDAKSSQDSVPDSPLEGSIKVDKKLSERLGLAALKNRGKTSVSNIPRLVQKKRESKVSTIARHFEQLSREFEKQRIKDRKMRAASLRQPRMMLARSSTRATVQVYDDVHEAFEEAAASNEAVVDAKGDPKTMPSNKQPGPAVLPEDVLTESPGEFPSRTDYTERDVDESVTATSQAGSDDEGGSEDDATVADEFLPDIKEIADATSDIPLELPKHQKTSLMKYLTTFWAERSAISWEPLEYPVNATDHIFVDSDIIVREDEPSSVIALALNSDDYQTKLDHIRREAQEIIQREGDAGTDSEPKAAPVSEASDWFLEEGDLENSLLRSTGTHLKYQFKEGQAIMTCKIFYAEQFDALRRKCGVAERIVESLSRCLKWDSRGGKTKSVFLKTLDDRLVLKSLSPVETSAFLRFAPGYFNIMAEALFHDLPSVIAKMFGFFQVIIKNPVTGADIKLDLVIMENLFYDRSPSRIFDLKGSMRNRKIQSTGEQNEVLLDENMVEYIYESPLFAREHSKKLLRASVWNDTLFLARQNVMDYSLMIAVDEARKELVVGIIDCIRTYTWDKKLESWIKDRGFAGGGRNRPTVTSPKEYKTRFREAMAR